MRAIKELSYSAIVSFLLDRTFRSFWGGGWARSGPGCEEGDAGGELAAQTLNLLKPISLGTRINLFRG